MTVKDESLTQLRLPFDEKNRVVPNAYGAVAVSADSADTIPRLYVTGWLKRGPTGIIGTNLTCADETIAKMAADFAVAPPPDPVEDGVDRLLEKRGVRVVRAADWIQIDRLERERGAARGKPREKFVSTADALKAIDRSL